MFRYLQRPAQVIDISHHFDTVIKTCMLVPIERIGKEIAFEYLSIALDAPRSILVRVKCLQKFIVAHRCCLKYVRDDDDGYDDDNDDDDDDDDDDD
uniref:Uncharacterized protein n=1 Tax=Glossina pallidipes TaxID=7398 RepID=A0A1B0A442_GLOPL